MEDAAEDVSEYEAFRRKRIADNDKVLLSLFGTSDPLEPVPDTSNRGSNTLAKKSSGPPTRKMQKRSEESAPRGITPSGITPLHHAEMTHSFSQAQNVWARDPLRYGDCWWPATVSATRPLAVAWDKPDGAEPVYSPPDPQLVRERLLCGCGSCTADKLPDEKAFEQHNKRVAACISHRSLRDRMKELREDANRYFVTLPAPRPP